jgi:hypothetical protein
VSQGAGVPSGAREEAVPVDGASRILVNGYLTNNESLITPDRQVNRNRPDPPSTESPVENTPQCAHPIEKRPPLASADNSSAIEIKTVVISTPITLSQRQVTAGDEVGDKTEHGARSNRQDIVVGRDPTPTKEEGVGFLPCNPGSDPDNSQYVCEMGEEEEEDSNTSGELISMSVVIYSLK